jgi:hypothetical protein
VRPFSSQAPTRQFEEPVRAMPNRNKPLSEERWPQPEVVRPFTTPAKNHQFEEPVSAMPNRNQPSRFQPRRSAPELLVPRRQLVTKAAKKPSRFGGY